MTTTCLNFTKKCGGCPLLAMPYREQLAQKQARLQELLGGFAPVKAVQGMTDPLHYRNKAIASFAAQHGKLVCGLYAEGTHKVLPGADCLLQEDILNKTLAAVLDAARTCRASPPQAGTSSAAVSRAHAARRRDLSNAMEASFCRCRYTCRNLRMASTEPPAPMTKPVRTNTPSTRKAMGWKGSTVIREMVSEPLMALPTST